MWHSVWFAVQDVALAQAPAPSGQPGLSSMLFPLILMFAVMYFLLILPNQRKDKQRRELLASLSKGNKVITHGGIVGTIVGINDKYIVLKVSDSPAVKIEFLRQAVSQVIEVEDEEKGE